MTNLQDLFVGVVSAVTGGIGIAAGLINWDPCFQLAKVQWVESRAGRTGARAVFIGGGCFFVVLGIAIACGFAPHQPAKKPPTRYAAQRPSPAVRR